MRRASQHVHKKWIGRVGLFQFETVVHSASRDRNDTCTINSGKKVVNTEVLQAYRDVVRHQV